MLHIEFAPVSQMTDVMVYLGKSLVIVSQSACIKFCCSGSGVRGFGVIVEVHNER